jgi:aryl-alcohol dehydrogenase-like predicted oxidoreductase
VRRRRIGTTEVAEIGLGCMNLNHAYGHAPDEPTTRRLLLGALELGVEYFDTAALYGFGRNETLIGEVLAPHRQRIFLASKCGMTGVDGKRVIDGRPETLKDTCAASLRRLRTDRIDLYYLHRWDKQVPIEDSVGALADMVSAGHVRYIGLSEVSKATLLRAHAVHPVSAVQSEFSLWSRNAELGVLEACRSIGAAFIAFAPLARGFLTDSLEERPDFAANDIRRGMPRFREPHYASNLRLLAGLRALAQEARCTPAQLALVWLLRRAPHVIPIPGTTSLAHLQENLGAARLTPGTDLLARLDALINTGTVSGARYSSDVLAEVDTEEPPGQVPSG